MRQTIPISGSAIGIICLPAAARDLPGQLLHKAASPRRAGCLPVAHPRENLRQAAARTVPA